MLMTRHLMTAALAGSLSLGFASAADAQQRQNLGAPMSTNRELPTDVCHPAHCMRTSTVARGTLAYCSGIDRNLCPSGRMWFRGGYDQNVGGVRITVVKRRCGCA